MIIVTAFYLFHFIYYRYIHTIRAKGILKETLEVIHPWLRYKFLLDLVGDPRDAQQLKIYQTMLITEKL